MPSLRIKFPEKDQPSTIALRGDRITVGRRPENTLQILDRTVSAFHAELIKEDGHYRLHDVGSSNGTYVNGDAITDYHLRESCKVAFGTLECEFEAAEVEEASEGLPTQAELAALLQSNEELKSQLDTVRTELASLRTQSPLNESGANTVPREEFEKVVLDRASLSERLHRSEAAFLKLREEVAILRRDRENLELAAESARKEVERIRSESVEAKPLAAAATPQPQQSAPAATPAPASAPAAVPKAAPAPAAPTPAGMPAPGAMPPASFPTPAKPGLPASFPKPAAAPAVIPVSPLPRAMPAAASAPRAPMSAGAETAAGSTIRQAPPAGVLPGATPRAVPQPAAAAAKPGAGPAGTQKISIPEAASPNAGPTKPAMPGAKMPMKPYVRPAVGSTASPSASTGAKPAGARDPRLQPEPEE